MEPEENRKREQADGGRNPSLNLSRLDWRSPLVLSVNIWRTVTMLIVSVVEPLFTLMSFWSISLLRFVQFSSQSSVSLNNWIIIPCNFFMLLFFLSPWILYVKAGKASTYNNGRWGISVECWGFCFFFVPLSLLLNAEAYLNLSFHEKKTQQWPMREQSERIF